ncbi:WD40-repeat-containing domain protein [Polychytrium aggregatum]|uniref:WD40-repeat-containing domain protein n=1 Tax=Polychytrium aggregatum TaxID=110093 RepID=UPI0022FE5496|nr:WD40-repeat-containing domain protein [Polychytrium aggregatum]KAI9204669.1 WD40-repeat-containing domain protein [Polychytrium aggregatum]
MVDQPLAVGRQDKLSLNRRLDLLSARSQLHRTSLQQVDTFSWLATSRAEITRSLVRLTGPQPVLNNHRIMRGHYACVNTIALSRPAGEFLASGGDDKRVLIWRVDDSPVPVPVACLGGHTNTILHVQFGSTARVLYSCGADGALCRYDVEHGIHVSPGISKFVQILPSHQERATKLSVQPTNDDVVLSSGHDGFVRLWDMRCSKPLQGEIKSSFHQNSVEFHPRNDGQFVTADAGGNVLLRDLRAISGRAWPRKRGLLMEYTTQLSKYNKSAHALDVSCATWNEDGSILGVVFRHYYPTLYRAEHKDPVCVLKSRTKVKGDGFRCSNTIKSGAFGSSFGNYFACGSEDFKIYGWSIPKPIPAPDVSWARSGSSRQFAGSETVFARENSKIRPVVLEDSFTISEPRSIINSVKFHPDRPYLFSCGIEKAIRLHSPFPISSAPGAADASLPHFYDMPDQNQNTELPQDLHPARAVYGDVSSMDEDPEVLRLFEALTNSSYPNSDWGESLEFPESQSSDSADMESVADDEFQAEIMESVQSSISSPSQISSASSEGLPDGDSDVEFSAPILSAFRTTESVFEERKRTMMAMMDSVEPCHPSRKRHRARARSSPTASNNDGGGGNDADEHGSPRRTSSGSDDELEQIFRLNSG